jgi:hypothetical protein
MLSSRTIEDDDWFYQGEFRDAQKHGRGIEKGKGTNAGQLYEGDFVDGKRHGWGTCTYKGGAWYAGNWARWRNGTRHGRGSLWLGDGARCFEGLWDKGFPVRGMAVEPDGTFRLVVFEAKVPLEDDATWQDAMKLAIGTEAGHIERWPMVRGQAAGAGRMGAWTGSVVRADGSLFKGELQGLCPVSGCETDCSGERFRVTYRGDLTLAEAPLPVSKQVRASFRIGNPSATRPPRAGRGHPLPRAVRPKGRPVPSQCRRPFWPSPAASHLPLTLRKRRFRLAPLALGSAPDSALRLRARSRSTGPGPASTPSTPSSPPPSRARDKPTAPPPTAARAPPPP